MPSFIHQIRFILAITLGSAIQRACCSFLNCLSFTPLWKVPKGSRALMDSLCIRRPIHQVLPSIGPKARILPQLQSQHSKYSKMLHFSDADIAKHFWIFQFHAMSPADYKNTGPPPTSRNCCPDIVKHSFCIFYIQLPGAYLWI